MRSPFGAARGRVRNIDRRWHDLPLRTRLTTAAALAATLTIVAVIAVAYLAVRHELRAQIDSQLRRQAGEVVVHTRFNPLSGSGGYEIRTQVGDIGGYSNVLSSDGRRGSGAALPVSKVDLRIARAGQGVALRDTHFAGQHVRMLTKALPATDGYAVQIALPLGDVDHQLHVLAGLFAVLAAGGLALTILLSWGAVRRVVRPVRELTETAEQIAATKDLTLRIPSEGNDELGRLATSFNTMLDALERSLGAQRQLVMDASHELRTPLASLRTNVEVLNHVDRLSPEQRAAVLAGIISQLEELTGLVADVVELARGEAPQSEHEDVALDDLVARGVDRARRHWPEVEFRVTTQPLVVRGVPGRLERAVANMLDNAGKFSPPGADVDVQLTATGTLTVADRGPGVPDEALPHVFDRFYRADEARGLPGSGLGLAIVHQVVEGHGGRITLTNRPGGGAVATLVLPAAGADITSADAVPDESQAAIDTALSDESVPVPVEETLFR
ncbi:MAG: two-component system, OmpR family, sensor histidine kinase MprB [Frankiaceae bacterium]|jgi:two-component system sensor histidine kinase MprB|nr:two-component system, OmpR family, sensor histidine kinase MprB [Frankiaceae bacterium]